MRDGFILFIFFIVFCFCELNYVICIKSPNKSELQNTKYPPCAACKIFVNSFKNVRIVFTK